MRRLLLTTCFSAALFTASPAWAQDRVNVRTGLHDGYSRLVFDWPEAVTFTAAADNNDAIIVTFARPALVDSAGVDIANAATIRGLDKVSGDGENLKYRVKIPAGAKFRQFTVGNKIIVDIYGSAKDAAAAPAAAKPVAAPEVKVESKKPEAKTASAPAAKPMTPKSAAAKPVVTAPAVKAENDAAPVRTEAHPPVPAAPAAAVEGLTKEAAPPPVMTQEVQPHVITVTSTNTVGLAAFRRNDTLWIVLDRSDAAVPPQLTGPQKILFSPFERVATAGASVWRTRLPDSVNISGDGAGLVWKMTVSTGDNTAVPVEAQRNFAPGDSLRGGTLFWPLQKVTRVVKVVDPDLGDTILAGTVTNAAQTTGGARDFVDVAMLEAPIGIAAVPKADDVAMEPAGNGVTVTRPGGLVLTRVRDMMQKVMSQAEAGKPGAVAAAPAADAAKMKLIFDFDRWMMGGLQALRENQQVLLSGMAAKDKTGRVQDLLMLAKMNMANDRGQEALGFLNFAETELPEIAQSPEFVALRGAAAVLAGKFENALEDLSTPVLKDYGEMDYWRAYTLAGLEDWQQAKEAMPKDLSVLTSYPLKIQERLGLKLAELALRAGNMQGANDLLEGLEKNRAALQPWTVAGLDYLSGEKHRQAKESKQAESLWSSLLKAKDDLYRVKAALALTLLQTQNKEITPEQAIDRLEGLRYHWRGDELEAQVNYTLGKLYLDAGRYEKGFTILKDAIAMAPDTDISRDIAGFMAGAFKDVFLSDKVNKVSPVDAATLYADFPELTPPGEEGNRMIERLAERLVDADLLDRSAALLKNLADFRLTGKAAADVGVRLAAIDLLNDDSAAAIAALDKAAGVYATLEQTPEIAQKQKDIQLLRARALSKMNKVQDALAILAKYPPAPDVNRLRADISWNAGMWADAAEALQDLILDETLDVATPLTQKQSDLILNRAVALNLSGDRVGLANMRSKYADSMSKTTRAKMFDVVTRQRTGSLSSDRESIAALVSEVDIFRDFLDSYKADTKGTN